MSEIYWYSRVTSTKFVVKNIVPYNKTVRIFNYPVYPNTTRDLLMIPGVSESDIRYSLLKGDLYIKLKHKELMVVESNIDLLQFNDEQRVFLEINGVNNGLEISGTGGGLTPENHETLRQLIHFIDDGPGDGFASGAYKVIIGQPFPTSITWYTDNSQSKKIIEKVIVRDSNQNPATITWNMYDIDGQTVIHSVVDTITYTNNVFESTRTRTIV